MRTSTHPNINLSQIYDSLNNGFLQTVAIDLKTTNKYVCLLIS
jgi:hypothetical protein